LVPDAERQLPPCVGGARVQCSDEARHLAGAG
jgi:hypothetical protein